MNPSNGFSDDKPNGSSGYRNGNSISRGDPDIKGSNGSDRSNHSNGNHASNGNISPLRITPVEERLTPTVTTGDRSSCSSHESNMDVVPNDGIALDISTDSNNSIFKYEKNEHKLVNGHYNGDSKSKHLNGSNGSFQSSLDITIIPSKTNFRYKLKFPHLLQEVWRYFEM